MSFVGPESILLANAALAAAAQDKFLEFNTYVYANQQSENSGYWTNDVLINTVGNALDLNTTTDYADTITYYTYETTITNIQNYCLNTII